MREWVIKYWLQFLFGIIIAGLTAFYKRKLNEVKERKRCDEELEKQRFEEFNLLKGAMQAVLRGQIIQLYNHCLDRGNTSRIYEKENATELYNSYHALGGNGVIDGIYKDLMNMNTK